MMKTLFGPWIIEKELKTEYCSRTGAKKEYTCLWVKDLRGRSVALYSDQYSKQENMNEIASLVAAAPELYDLVDLLASVLVNAVDPNDFGKILNEKVLPVLKKARGEGE